jgi:hypothetical protein
MPIRLICWSILVSVVAAGCAATAPTGPSAETSASATVSRAADEAGGIRVAIRSHCGVRGAVVNGDLWLASPPLGGHNPPPGWDENQTRGRFLITGARRAVFNGDGGQRAHFRLAPEGTVDPNAGCE